MTITTGQFVVAVMNLISSGVLVALFAQSFELVSLRDRIRLRIWWRIGSLVSGLVFLFWVVVIMVQVARAL